MLLSADVDFQVLYIIWQIDVHVIITCYTVDKDYLIFYYEDRIIDMTFFLEKA